MLGSNIEAKFQHSEPCNLSPMERFLDQKKDWVEKYRILLT